jgi:predicted transcriptional regulator
MTIIEALQNLGLTDKEARVYTALLKRGRTSAYGIAEESGLKKPTTYVILDDLIEKGLASRIPRVRKQLFVAKPPEELFAMAEERISLAKTILPQLKAMKEGEKPKPRTLFFEGMKGVKENFRWENRKMKDKETLGFYAHSGDASKELVEFFIENMEDFKKNNNRMRGIVPDHPNLDWARKTDGKYNRQLKTIPLDEYSANISVTVGDDFISFFSFRDLQITRIENKDIADTMKQIFEIVWKTRLEKATKLIEK